MIAGETPSANPKATPEFRECVRSRNETTSTCSPLAISETTSAFEAWSSAIAAAQTSRPRRRSFRLRASTRDQADDDPLSDEQQDDRDDRAQVEHHPAALERRQEPP